MTQDIRLPRFNLPRFKRRRTVIRQGTALVLTPLGKQKANSFGLDGVKFDVLSTMAEQGPCTIAEISNEIGISDKRTQQVVKSLTQAGYVRVASNEE